VQLTNTNTTTKVKLVVKGEGKGSEVKGTSETRIPNRSGPVKLRGVFR